MLWEEDGPADILFRSLSKVGERFAQDLVELPVAC